MFQYSPPKDMAGKIARIQGLRGLAVFLVLISHSKLGFENGYLGVDVFFVISGYVITRQISSLTTSGRFSFRHFYRQRFARLFPALGVALIVSSSIALVLLNPRALAQSLMTGVASLFGLANVAVHLQTGDYFAPSAYANSMTHTWSLSVEEQFYLLYPVLLLFAIFLSKRFRKLTVPKLIATGTVISLSLFLISPGFQGELGIGALLGYYSPLVRAWEFGIGALAYLLSGRPERLVSSEAPGWIIFGLPLVSIIALASLPGLSSEARVWATTACAIVTAAILANALSPNHHAWDFLESRWFLWLGERSYSIYLYHWPIFVFIGFATNWAEDLWLSLVGVLLALLLGNVSWNFIERGSLHRAATRRPLVFASIMGSTSLALTFAVSQIYPSLHPNAVAVWRATSDATLSSGTCNPLENWCSQGSIWSAPQELDSPIYLIGDSNALMYAGALANVSEDLGAQLVVRAATGCTGAAESFGNNSMVCSLFKAEIRNVLSEAPNGLVMLGFTDNYVLSGKYHYLENSNLLLETMTELRSELEDYGHEVSLIEPIANLNWHSGSVDPELIPNHRLSSIITVPWSKDDLFRAVYLEANLEHASWLSTSAALCPDNVCVVFDGERLIWSDSNHLSPYGASLVVRNWVSELTRFGDK